MEKRFTLTHGFTRYRWLFVVIAFFVIMELISEERRILLDIILLLICIGGYYLLWASRKIKFDNQYLYLIKGQNEKSVPLRNVKSLKATGSRVNGRRIWIIVYEDEGVQERKCRFIPYIFGNYIKEFKTILEKNNPEVVIWNHPHFHD